MSAHLLQACNSYTACNKCTVLTKLYSICNITGLPITEEALADVREVGDVRWCWRRLYSSWGLQGMWTYNTWKLIKLNHVMQLIHICSLNIIMFNKEIHNNCKTLINEQFLNKAFINNQEQLLIKNPYFVFPQHQT